jgi:apolipoprotein N-acyltransferase
LRPLTKLCGCYIITILNITIKQMKGETVNIRKIVLSILSGVLLCFSFPNFIQPGLVYFSWFFIWFAFLPLFYAVLDEGSAKDTLILSMITGSVFYIMSLYWLQFVGPMGAFAYVSWIILSIYLAVWLAVPVFFAKIVKQRFNTPYLISLPLLLTIGEYIREWLFTGFPLLTPAQSMGQFLPLLQLLKMTGIPGLNYVIY